MADYTLYLDESGDHGLIRFNQAYPVMAICGVAVENGVYSKDVLPRLDEFKVQQFGSAGVELHYRGFVQRAGPFRKLADSSAAWAFEGALAQLVAELDITNFCAVIRKNSYLQRYGPTRPVDQYLPTDLYLMALDFVLERGVKFLEEKWPATGSLIAEGRGKREDEQVLAEYHELLARGTQFVSGERFRRVFQADLKFFRKGGGVAGLEIADVCASPIATQVLRPGTNSALWEAIRSKIWIGTGQRSEGNLGLKCFPRDADLDAVFESLG
jgi:hypothetical protein